MDLNTAPVVIHSKKEHTQTIIWLHGLGADGHDFAPIAPSFNLEGTKFIFPHAKHRSITINNGMRMRGWYDIFSFNRGERQDEAGILESSLEIQKLIQKEINCGIQPEHIFLAGFSQGAAMSLFTGLRYPKPLAGIIALSGYLPLPEKIKTERSSQNQTVPIFMAHGTCDTIVPIQLPQYSKQCLESLGYKIHWHTYAMDHSVCAEEIQAIGRFLRT